MVCGALEMLDQLIISAKRASSMSQGGAAAAIILSQNARTPNFVAILR